MAKVWVANNAGHDFSVASKFGEIKHVTEGNINIFRPDRDLFNITDKLGEFDYKEDYLLLSGNVFVNIMVASVLFIQHRVKSVKLLIYDAKSHNYIQHTLSTNKKEVKFLRKNENE